MKPRLILTASMCLFMGVTIRPLAAETGPGSSQSPFPLQVEMSVPFEPTAVPSGGRKFLVYELYLTNFSQSAIGLRSIEILDDRNANAPVATFEGDALQSMLQPVGRNPSASSPPRTLPPGATDIVFIWIPFGPGAHLPDQLRHRLVTNDSELEGAVIGTHHAQLITLGPPLTGAAWKAGDGPGNDPDNHHRRGVFVLDGRPVDSRRYAIDWVKSVGQATLSGNPDDKRSYYAYGQPVLAVANATVVSVRDGQPDNVPGHGDKFRTAVPITLDNVGGNTISLDLGGGQFAYYFHLQPGSVRVKVGDHVRRGQVMASVGCSGDAREPHLHFEVTTSGKALFGDGVPYVIDRYRLSTADGHWETRSGELPLDGALIDFGTNDRP